MVTVWLSLGKEELKDDPSSHRLPSSTNLGGRETLVGSGFSFIECRKKWVYW